MSAGLHARRVRRRPVPMVLVGLALLVASLLLPGGVYAALSSRAAGSGTVSSGTLNLRVGADVGAGFSTFTPKMAPGDTDNVYVNLTDTGTLATAAGMRLWVAAAPASPLSNGAAAGEGLNVRLTLCSVAWTLATGVCPGTVTTLLAARQISTMGTAATASPLANVPALAAGGSIAHVQVTLGLAGTEQSVNAKPPPITIQASTVALTYSFVVTQRAGVATNH